MRQHGTVAPRQEMGRLHFDFESSVVRAARRAVASMRAISLARLQHSAEGFRPCLIKMSEGPDRCGTVGQLGSHSQKDLKKEVLLLLLSAFQHPVLLTAVRAGTFSIGPFNCTVSCQARRRIRISFEGCISAEALDGRSLVSRQKDRGVAAGIGSSRFRGLEEEKQRTTTAPESHAAQAREIYIRPIIQYRIVWKP
jgi:hypothetical protein